MDHSAHREERLNGAGHLSWRAIAKRVTEASLCAISAPLFSFTRGQYLCKLLYCIAREVAEAGILSA
jgi:hypothetical protein